MTEKDVMSSDPRTVAVKRFQMVVDASRCLNLSEESCDCEASAVRDSESFCRQEGVNDFLLAAAEWQLEATGPVRNTQAPIHPLAV